MSILRAVLVGALVPISVPVAAVAAPVEHVYEAVVPADRRAVALGDGWARSTDQSWITVGDQDGFHLLTADASDGYRRTAGHR